MTTTELLFTALHADTAAGGPALDADVAMIAAQQVASLFASEPDIAVELKRTEPAVVPTLAPRTIEDEFAVWAAIDAQAGFGLDAA